MRLFLTTWLLLAASDIACAANVSLQGALALGPDAANDTASHIFTLGAASNIIVQSYGYGGSANAPGGRNLSGVVIPAGGFDPYVSVFAGSGAGAVFVASNDDGVCPPGALSAGVCRDSRLSLILAPGTYTLVISAFLNTSLAENLGTGVLGDGFTGLGNYDPLRSNNYAVDISGLDEPALTAPVIPTLSTAMILLLSTILVGTGVWAQRKRRL